MNIDIDAVTAIIAEAAAEEIAPRWGQLAADDIREKNPNDFVTVADLAMERRLSAALSALRPGSVVVGEEGVAADPSELDRLSGDAEVWVIDPLDGTGNFTRGGEQIAVLVALVTAGETRAGWIHDPLTRVTIAGELGGGAWRAGERLQLRPVGARLLRGSISAGFLRRTINERRDLLAEHLEFEPPLMCAGQEYIKLITGVMDFVVFSRLKPWDHAAGVLLHGEAGGANIEIGGGAYRPIDRDGRLMMAPSAADLRRLTALLITDD